MVETRSRGNRAPKTRAGPTDTGRPGAKRPRINRGNFSEASGAAFGVTSAGRPGSAPSVREDALNASAGGGESQQVDLKQTAALSPRSIVRKMIQSMKEDFQDIEVSEVNNAENNFEGLFKDLDSADAALRDGAPQAEILQIIKRMETCLLSSIRLSYSMWQGLKEMRSTVSKLTEENERFRMLSRFMEWIRLFRLIVVTYGHYSSYSNLQVKLEGEAVASNKWAESEHQKVSNLFAKAPFAQFDITTSVFDVSINLRSERNETCHGGRLRDEEITGRNVEVMFNKDLEELKSLYVSAEEKNAIQKIMRCVKFTLEGLCGEALKAESLAQSR